MRKPGTADERHRRMVEYLSSVHRGRILEFKLSRLNKIANFRKQLKVLLDDLIEARAEDLAAGMLMEHAPPRPQRTKVDVREERLPAPPKKVRKPIWMRESGEGRARKRA